MVVLCVEFFAKVQNQMFLMQSTYKLCFRDDCIKKTPVLSWSFKRLMQRLT